MANKHISWSWLFLLILFLGACGNNTNEGVQPYDKDGVLGTTNTNPNLQTSPTYHTYTNDQDLIQKTLAGFKDIRQPRLVFNGYSVVVYYAVPSRYTEAQAQRLENRVVRKLQEMLPRYKFDMRRSTR